MSLQWLKLTSALKATVSYFAHTSDKNELTGLAVSLPYGDDYFYDKLCDVYGEIGLDSKYINWLGKFVDGTSYGYYDYDSFSDNWGGWGSYEDDYGWNSQGGGFGDYFWDYGDYDYYYDGYDYGSYDSGYADDWIYDYEMELWYCYDGETLYFYDDESNILFYYDEYYDEFYYYDENDDDWYLLE